jgi:hypothetical protein
MSSKDTKETLCQFCQVMDTLVGHQGPENALTG